MADKRLEQLPTATTLGSSDLIHISQSGIDKRINSDVLVAQLNSGVAFNFQVKEESSTERTLSVSDRTSYIRCLNAGTTSIIVPPTSEVPWTLGDQVMIRRQDGKVNISGGSGVTINGGVTGLSLLSGGQDGILTYVGSNTWDLETGGTTEGINGTVIEYDPLTTYTEIDEWVREDGIIYRPDASLLPIGPEAFDASKWIIAQITGADDLPLEINGVGTTVQEYLQSISSKETVAEAKNLTNEQLELLVNSSQRVTTLYNNSTSKSGGASYIVYPVTDYPGTPDGYGDHYAGSTDDYILKLDHENNFHVDKFGAIADADVDDETLGTDNTGAFKSCIEAARPSVASIKFTGNYRIEDTLFFGPKNQASIDTFPPNNICAGISCDGTSEENSIVCGDGLYNKVVLDYTGLGNARIARGFTIYRKTETNAPSVGILTARFLNGAGVTGNYGGIFEDIVFFKYFRISCRLAISTEETREIRLNMRNDHPSSFGCFVTTSDGSSEAYTHSASGTSFSWNELIGPQLESELTREDVAGSNLHQTHTKCDYYYGNNSGDPDKNPCMLRIDGANGFLCKDAFFNNNYISIDCVQIRKAGDLGVPYGIEITNPLYHQNVKSGVRVMTGMNRLILNGSNKLPGFNFVESELVVNGYLSGASINSVDSVEVTETGTLDNCNVEYCTGTVSASGTINNSTFACVNTFNINVVGAVINSCNIQCNIMNYNTNRSVTNTTIKIDDVLNLLSDRTGTTQVTIEYNGAIHHIHGQMKTGWLGTPANLTSTTQSIRSSNLGDNSRLIQRGGTGYNYLVCEADGEDEILVSRGGTLEYTKSTGGAILRASDGTRWRTVVDPLGVLTTVQVL